MAANQPQWPREWLMTDERIGERLWAAVDALPDGAGIVFRHYGLDAAARLALGLRLAEAVATRDLLLAVAGSEALAEQLGAVLVHNPRPAGAMPFSISVHGDRDVISTRRAALAFVAPVFPTGSHPGAPALGMAGAAALAGRLGCPAIALGGMDDQRFALLEAAHPGAFHGYAGIDCWLKKSTRT